MLASDKNLFLFQKHRNVFHNHLNTQIRLFLGSAVPHFQPENHTLEQDTRMEVWYTPTMPCKPHMVHISSEVSYAAAGPQVVEPEDQLRC
ncbi:hypothetical protein GN956_G27105 [Arapaima gigas]